MSQKPSSAGRGHNGAPSFDDDLLPEWGEGSIGTYFAWKSIPVEIAIRRAHKAAALGLTYEEYTLEILERGRYLQASDTKRIAEIKSRRVHDLVE